MPPANVELEGLAKINRQAFEMLNMAQVKFLTLNYQKIRDILTC
jgi:hypothetical protein